MQFDGFSSCFSRRSVRLDFSCGRFFSWTGFGIGLYRQKFVPHRTGSLDGHMEAETSPLAAYLMYVVVVLVSRGGSRFPRTASVLR